MLKIRPKKLRGKTITKFLMSQKQQQRQISKRLIRKQL